MKVKDDSVNIWGLELPMRKVLKEADKLWKHFGQELIITSARDGIHSAGSLHYYGLAVDLRTRYFEDSVKEHLGRQLQTILGHQYDVIVERTHIHVEYDS